MAHPIPISVTKRQSPHTYGCPTPGRLVTVLIPKVSAMTSRHFCTAK